MFKTLNNDCARHILLCAVNGNARYCAYSLYNHYYGDTFDAAVFRRLYFLCIELLGDNCSKFFTDDSIEYCVRDFLNRYYTSFQNG